MLCKRKFPMQFLVAGNGNALQYNAIFKIQVCTKRTDKID